MVHSRGLLLVVLATLLHLSNALYFYLEAGENRCFLEELPKDTIVVGESPIPRFYAAACHVLALIGLNDGQGITRRKNGPKRVNPTSSTTNSESRSSSRSVPLLPAQLPFQNSPRSIRPTQESESGDKVVNTRGLPQGKFTFTSHEAGDHTICLRSNYTGGWFSTPQVRMHLDIAVGEAKVDEEGEKEHVKDLAGKVKDLNSRLADIAREQRFQREREEEFKTLSERTNARAVYWSIAQMVTLLLTCTWQLRHLRRFFESKKLSVFPLVLIMPD